MPPTPTAELPPIIYERYPGAAAAPLPAGYRPRQPERTALHTIVREHLETFLADARGPLPYDRIVTALRSNSGPAGGCTMRAGAVRSAPEKFLAAQLSRRSCQFRFESPYAPYGPLKRRLSQKVWVTPCHKFFNFRLVLSKNLQRNKANPPRSTLLDLLEELDQEAGVLGIIMIFADNEQLVSQYIFHESSLGSALLSFAFR